MRLKANNYPKGVNVNYILSKKGPVYDVVLHWYQSEGTKVLSTGIKQNIQRFIGRVFSNRNDGGFVRVSVTTNADQIEEANKKVIFFSQKVLGLLPKYWPLEK